MNLNKSYHHDPLKLLYHLTFGLIRVRLFRNALVLVCIIHGFVNLLQIVDLLVTFDSNLLIQYGPSLMISSNAVYGIWAAFVIERTVSIISLDSSFGVDQNWNDVDQILTAKIFTESKVVTASQLFILMYLLIFTILFWPIFTEDNLFYAIKIFRDHFDTFTAKLLCLLYYSTFPLLGYAGFVNGGLAVHTISHNTHSVYIINDNLKTMAKKIPFDGKESPVSCEKYQNAVFSQLRICIQRHQSMKETTNKINRVLYPHMIVLVAAGMMVTVSVLFKILKNDSHVNYVIVMLGATLSSMVPFLVTTLTQKFKDEQEKILENLFDCPWTCWNLKNRKTMLIFMTNLLKPAILGHPDLLAFEYAFIPKVFNFTWSVAVFCYQYFHRQAK